MVNWQNKILIAGALLAAESLSAQQTESALDLPPLSFESVLLPEPLKVHVPTTTAKPSAPVATAIPNQPAISVTPTPLADKKDLDEAMTARIAYGSTLPIQPVDPKTLVLHSIDSTGILRTEGDIYWIEQLASDLYFQTFGDTLQTLWSRDFPAQSLSNLLLGQVKNPDFGIDLTHRRYGIEKPRFHVSWASLYNTLCTDEVRRYATGFTKDEGKTLRGVLLVHHPVGNYVHMLILTTTVDELFAPEGKRKDLRADLFTNVPQNNILNLYE